MKTAMQELMEILEAKILPSDNNNEYMNAMNAANNNIIYYIKKEFIEKEKEQIAKAWDERAKPYPYEGAEQWEVMDCTGEFYYEQTYNQNK